MVIALSILDQSPVPSGSTAAEAVRDTLALARAADRLGYRRYWLAEHHNTTSMAGSAPEILAACVAAQTSAIRVGSGGVLLTHYSPLKVAETFRMLEVLFPGRIDLGVGRADGSDAPAVAALQAGRDAPGEEDYPDLLADLVAFLDGAHGPDHRYAGVRAMPETPGAPEVWVLGSSSYGGRLAARSGLPFSFAHFVSPKFGSQVMAAYRRQFQPSRRCPGPRGSVGVSVVCAETDAEAERLATSQDVWHLRPEGARRGELLSWEEAEGYRATELELELLAQHRSRRVVGAPDRVHAALTTLAATYGVDELVVRTVCHDPADRLRSYQLLAQVFALA
ncbi:MAG: LLM class flavin-dependent oxidoreductase [Actinomycetota bacterium]|nr:LLM class flavin-dependent oxidoreductase [Actinomycetota bacterium]MDQ6948575.1 LLM class flavin-dependent oxidoreductase [Actinomycetota bacterium]